MRVELLVVPDCPNERLALATIADAAACAGVEVPEVTVSVIRDLEQAAVRGFTGSPTILVDGSDPFASPDAPIGLSCRVYRTPAGLAGVPDADDLGDVFLRAGGGR